QSLVDDLHTAVQKAGQDIGIDTGAIAMTIKTERKSAPAVSIIKHVLKGSIDLVIKQAEQKEDNKGFKALDMVLLRQCPCPVWLCQPIKSDCQNIKIAVAI